MSLEDRTLVVRNLNGDIVSKELLQELFSQSGPVLNVVLRSDFAYIEFEHKVSVGYALALMNGISIYGQPLHLMPKDRSDSSQYHYLESINQFNRFMEFNPDFFTKFMPNEVHSSGSDKEEVVIVAERRSGDYDYRNRGNDYRQRSYDFRQTSGNEYQNSGNGNQYHNRGYNYQNSGHHYQNKPNDYQNTGNNYQRRQSDNQYLERNRYPEFDRRHSNHRSNSFR